MYEVYDNSDMQSNWGKTKCLDEDLVYCANRDMTSGYCCSAFEPCPRESYCSNDNPKAPLIFRLFVCPNEAACEGRDMTPQYDGEVLTR